MYLAFYFKRSLELLSVALINITQMSQCSRAIPDDGGKKISHGPMVVQTLHLSTLYQQKGFVPLTAQFFLFYVSPNLFFANLGSLQDLSI